MLFYSDLALGLDLNKVLNIIKVKGRKLLIELEISSDSKPEMLIFSLQSVFLENIQAFSLTIMSEAI